MQIKRFGKKVIAMVLAVILLLSVSSIEVFALEINGETNQDYDDFGPSNTNYTIDEKILGDGLKTPYGYRFSIVDQSNGMVVGFKDEEADIIIKSYDIYFNKYSNIPTTSYMFTTVRSKMDWHNDMRNKSPSYPGNGMGLILEKTYGDCTNGAYGYEGSTIESSLPTTDKMEAWLQLFSYQILNLFGESVNEDTTDEHMYSKGYILMVEPIYGMGFPNGQRIVGTPCDLIMYFAALTSANSADNTLIKGVGYTFNARWTGSAYGDSANPKYNFYYLSKTIGGIFPYQMRLSDDYDFDNGIKLVEIGERKDDPNDSDATGFIYPTIDEEDKPTSSQVESGYRSRLRAKDVIEGGYGCMIAFSKDDLPPDIEVDLSTTVSVNADKVLSGETITVTYEFTNNSANDAKANIQYGGKSENNVTIASNTTITRTETYTNTALTTNATKNVSFSSSISAATGYVDIDNTDNSDTASSTVYPIDIKTSIIINPEKDGFPSGDNVSVQYRFDIVYDFENGPVKEFDVNLYYDNTVSSGEPSYKEKYTFDDYNRSYITDAEEFNLNHNNNGVPSEYDPTQRYFKSKVEFTNTDIRNTVVETNTDNNSCVEPVKVGSVNLRVDSIQIFVVNNYTNDSEYKLGEKITLIDGNNIGTYLPCGKIAIKYKFKNDSEYPVNVWMKYGLADGITGKDRNSDTYDNIPLTLSANGTWEDIIIYDYAELLSNAESEMVQPFAEIYLNAYHQTSDKGTVYETNQNDNSMDKQFIKNEFDLTTVIKFYKYDFINKKYNEIQKNDLLNKIKSGDKIMVEFYAKSNVPNIQLIADVSGTAYGATYNAPDFALTFNSDGLSNLIYSQEFIFDNNTANIISESFDGNIKITSATAIVSTTSSNTDHVWYEVEQGNNAYEEQVRVYPVDLSVTFKAYAVLEKNSSGIITKLEEIDNLQDNLGWINSNGVEVPYKEIYVEYFFVNNTALPVDAFMKYGLADGTSVGDTTIERENIAANSSTIKYAVYNVDKIRNDDDTHNKLFAEIYLADYGEDNVEYESDGSNNIWSKYLRVIPIDLVANIELWVNNTKINVNDFAFDINNIVADGKNLEIKSGDKIKIIYTFSHDFNENISVKYTYTDCTDDGTQSSFFTKTETAQFSKNNPLTLNPIEFTIRNTSDVEVLSDILTAFATITNVPWKNVWYEVDSTNNIQQVTTEIYSVDLIGNAEIVVLDEENNEIVGNIQEGSEIKVKYTYENTCDLPVDVIVHYVVDSDGTIKTEEITIPPNSKVEIITEPFTVEVAVEDIALNLKSEVYMNEYDEDTEYEIDGTNNTSELRKEADSPFNAELQQPNSEYRRGINVVTSFLVSNAAKFDYDGIYTAYNPNIKINNDLIARLEIYTDINKTLIYDTIDCSYVIPSEEQTLVWFGWQVPMDASVDKVYCTLTLDVNNVYSNDKYLENDDNSKVVKVEFDIAENIIVRTPDTEFTGETPYWYNYSKNSLERSADRTHSLHAEQITPTLSWSYWSFDGTAKRFDKITETASVLNSKITITPDNSSAFQNSRGDWIIKSGYGFTLNTNFVNPALENDDCTLIQTAYCTFPEFGYNTADVYNADRLGHKASYYFGNSYNNAVYGFDSIYDETTHNLLYPKSGGRYGTYTTLVHDADAGQFKFPVNDTIDKDKHYIPVWQPDGLYTVICYYSDAWTPAGMLSGTAISNSMYVSGTMYDDLYFISY